MPDAGPDFPEVLPRDKYSALMGLLCSSGANLARGPNCWHYPMSTVLKLSSSNLPFLEWMMEQFSPYLTWNPILNASSKGASMSLRSLSHTSYYLYILRMHWYHEGIHLLPIHFEEYFD